MQIKKFGRTIVFTELVKASFLGLSVGLLLVGVMELTLVAIASDWLATFRNEYAFDVFTGAGAIIGAVVHLISRV